MQPWRWKRGLPLGISVRGSPESAAQTGPPARKSRVVHRQQKCKRMRSCLSGPAARKEETDKMTYPFDFDVALPLGVGLEVVCVTGNLKLPQDGCLLFRRMVLRGFVSENLRMGAHAERRL
eukprot:scaffold1875_cov339-Prasinococcus_capsulatus_cf.AAC.10